MKINEFSWYCMDINNRIDEYKEPNLSIKNRVKYWIKMINLGRVATTSYPNTYTLFNYETFNPELIPTKIKVDNIECIDCFDTYYTHESGSITKFIISDGIISDFEKVFYAGKGTKGYWNFPKLIQFLEEINEYKSIKAYQVYLENEKLKEEIEKLKRR